MLVFKQLFAFFKARHSIKMQNLTITLSRPAKFWHTIIGYWFNAWFMAVAKSPSWTDIQKHFWFYDFFLKNCIFCLFLCLICSQCGYPNHHNSIYSVFLCTIIGYQYNALFMVTEKLPNCTNIKKHFWFFWRTALLITPFFAKFVLNADTQTITIPFILSFCAQL
jgi:hypothetical protein